MLLEQLSQVEKSVKRILEFSMLCLHEESVDGCSAEGHVSNVLSDRLSSRPKGWSKTGADTISSSRSRIICAN